MMAKFETMKYANELSFMMLLLTSFYGHKRNMRREELAVNLHFYIDFMLFEYKHLIIKIILKKVFAFMSFIKINSCD